MKNPLQGNIIFLHGFNKSGKTNLAYGFPDPIILATERGHRYAPEHVKKRMIKLDPEEGWATLKRTTTKLKKKSFKTVVVDTVDNLYRWAMLAIMAKKHGTRIDHPGDADDFGASWDAVRYGFTHEMGRLASVCDEKNATLLLISHSSYREIEGLTTKHTKVMTSLPGQAQDILLAEPDDIWHLAFGASEDKRILHLMGTEEIQCGSRSPTLEVGKVSLPREPREAYLAVCKAYLKKKKQKRT